MAPASPQLDVLKFDILLQICLLVGHIPQEDYRQVEQHRLRPLSMVNKRFRDVCIPLLFRRSSVTVYLSWVVARPWQSTLETITRMDNSLVLGRHVRALQFQIEINYSRPEECYIAGKAPPEDLPQLLARVLARMTCLEQLAFNLPTDHTAIFAEKFAEAQLVLPLVRKLDIANMCGFLVKMCPNVKEIQNWRCPYGQKKTTPDFLNGIANASKLEIFTKRDFWTADFLKEMERVLPQISALSLAAVPELPEVNTTRYDFGRNYEVRIVDGQGIIRRYVEDRWLTHVQLLKGGTDTRGTWDV